MEEIKYLESVDGNTVEVMSSGERYVRIPLEKYFKMRASNPIAFEVPPQAPAPNHGSFKDLLGDDPQMSEFLGMQRQKEGIDCEEIPFTDVNELLLWVLNRQADGEGVLPYDDTRACTVGFTVSGKHAFIRLTDLRKSPLLSSVLEKFGPVPGAVLRIIQGNPYNLLASSDGRDWLAQKSLFSNLKDLPDIAPLDEIWAAEAEQSKMLDEGDLGIPRPV